MVANGKYLLDTSVIIALFADDPAVKEYLKEVEEIYIPCIAIGELCYGAWKSAQRERNLARIEEFADDNVILECSEETAWHYGKIKNALREKGRFIPEKRPLDRCDCPTTRLYRGNARYSFS